MQAERTTNAPLPATERLLPAPVRFVVVGVIYLVCWSLLDRVSLQFETVPEISIWYPPFALDVVLILVFGPRHAFWLVLNNFVHPLVVQRTFPLGTILIEDAITTVGYAGAALLLTHVVRIDARLRRLRDVGYFISIAACAASFVVACFHTADLYIAGLLQNQNAVESVLHYWAGGSTGVAMLAPPLLIGLRAFPRLWAERESPAAVAPSLPFAFSPKRLAITAVEVSALALAIWITNGRKPGGNLNYPYVIFLPLLWIAVRHGLERTALAVLLINIGARCCTTSARWAYPTRFCTRAPPSPTRSGR